MRRELRDINGFTKGDPCRVQGMVLERAVRLNAEFVCSYTTRDGEEIAVVRLNCRDPWQRHTDTINVPLSTVKHK